MTTRRKFSNPKKMARKIAKHSQKIQRSKRT
jgi:hypothetical protein